MLFEEALNLLFDEASPHNSDDLRLQPLEKASRSVEAVSKKRIEEIELRNREYFCRFLGRPS